MLFLDLYQLQYIPSLNFSKRSSFIILLIYFIPPPLKKRLINGTCYNDQVHITRIFKIFRNEESCEKNFSSRRGSCQLSLINLSFIFGCNNERKKRKNEEYLGLILLTASHEQIQHGRKSREANCMYMSSPPVPLNELNPNIVLPKSTPRPMYRDAGWGRYPTRNPE